MLEHEYENDVDSVCFISVKTHMGDVHGNIYSFCMELQRPRGSKETNQFICVLKQKRRKTAIFYLNMFN